jgi:DNA helicase-2/ATP-dependent DNA helicase PcrA
MSDPIFQGLNPAQAEAVSWCGGPELVLAGAGSGKTRVLASKIAYLVSEIRVPPNGILALTFTNKAAREMKDRVMSLVGENLRGMQVSTFHSYGLRFLFRNGSALSRLGYPSGFSVFDRGDCQSLIRRLARELGFPKTYSPAELTDKISAAKSAVDPMTLAPDIEPRFALLYEKYQAEMRRIGALDFDDLMVLPLHILLRDGEIRESERAYVEWTLVDEYQDVNFLQYELIRVIVGGSGRLMAVGDPDQSIYGWRGADMSLIMRFESEFSGARVFMLEQNYRSTANILGAANSVIKNNDDRYEKNLWTDFSEGEKVRVLLLPDDESESGFIADEIERLIFDSKYEYGEMAVLYRVNALSRGLEQKLLERGVPYRMVRGVSFYERREVKDAISMMRLAVNPRDTVSLERAANVPPRGLGKKYAADIANALMNAQGSPEDIWAEMEKNPPVKGKAAGGARELASMMLGILRSGTLSGAIDFILNNGYEAYLMEQFREEWEDRLGNVRELLSIMPEDGDIAEALAQVALFTDQERAGEGDSVVNLLTMHAAKGLEFPVVFLIGFEEGLFPSMRTELEGDVEEERRLCYVGMTRARERLYITSAAKRLLYGGYKRSPFSRFIREIDGGCAELDDRRKTGGNVRGGDNRRRWSW